MRFSVQRNDLFKGLQKVSSVVPSRSLLPILGNILFTAKNNSLTLVATDLEISVVTQLPVKGKEDGSIAIPARIINDIIKELPDSELEISSDDKNKIQLKSDQGLYKISGEKDEEFPKLPEIDKKNEVSITDSLLKRMIDIALFAASTDELRPALMGVLFQFKENELRVIATDGHRLVRAIKKNVKIKDIDTDVIIPVKTLNLVSRNLGAQSFKSLLLSENHVVFHFNDSTVYSRIINETYPDYERVIPTTNQKILTVDNGLLQSSVKRVSIFASPVTHQVRFSMKKTAIEISAEDVDFGGEAKENVPASFSGDTLEIGYNSNYILDLLKHINSPEVVFKLNTSTSAAIVLPSKQETDEDLLMLLMPVRLND